MHDVKARSYFDFDISRVPSSATVLEATLQLTVNNSYYPDCRGTTTVHFTSYINSSMYWGNEPSKGWGVSGDGYVGTINQGNKPSNGSECTGNWQRTSSVTPGINALRDAGRTQATFGLYASTYASAEDWRRFKTNPGLSIKYGLPPMLPTSRTSLNGDHPLGCSPTTGVDWSGKGKFTIAAKLSNYARPYGGELEGEEGKIKARFAVKRPGSTSWSYSETTPKSSGGTHSKTLDRDSIPDGRLEWRVRAEDEVENETAFIGYDVDQSCVVMMDSRSPDTPRVSSIDYPLSIGADNEKAGGIGKTGAFTLSPGTPTGSQGTVDIAYYAWSLESPDALNEPGVPKAVPGSDGKATIAITPTKTGLQTLWVKAFDKAGNPSDRVATPGDGQSNDYEAYLFNVSDNVRPSGSWELDGNGADVDNRSSFTLQGSASYGEGYTGQALHLPGTGGAYARSSLDLDTSKSFTVAAWTRLDSKDADGVAIAKDGSASSRFKLLYLQSQDRWSFSLYSANVSAPTATRINSTSSPRVNEWTHVAAVFDQASRKATLYVDGRKQGVPVEVPGIAWNATERFVLGAGKHNSATSAYFRGDIDAVRAYDRALPDAEIETLANVLTERSWYVLNEDSGTTAADSLEGRPGTVTGLAAPTTANLVTNGDLESWSDGAPECVDEDGWGDSTRELTQAPGRQGHAAQLAVSDYVDGVRHLGPSQSSCAPEVTPGQRYDVSLWYQSDTDEISVDAFVQQEDGTWTWWTTLNELYAASDWRQAAATTPSVPDGVQRMAVRLSVRSTGTVLLDDMRAVLSNDGTENESRPGTVAWNPDGKGAAFAGWGGQQMGDIAASLAPTVSYRKSFSISADVRPDGFDVSARQAVSLSGSRYMPIGLGYRPEQDGRFVATIVTGSQESPVAHRIYSDRTAAEEQEQTPREDGIVNLALVYDHARGTHGAVTFYVNGSPKTLLLDGPLAADGRSVVIGRGTWPWTDGNKVDPWKGLVQDVHVASGAAPLNCLLAWSEGGSCIGGEET